MERVDHERLPRGGRSRVTEGAVLADLEPGAQFPVGVEEPQRRAQRAVVLEGHNRPDALLLSDLYQRRWEAEELLDVDDVGAERAQHGPELRLQVRLVEIELRIPGTQLEARDDRPVDHLVHGDLAPLPASHPGPRRTCEVAAGEEVPDVVATLHLRGHQILGVVD